MTKILVTTILNNYYTIFSRIFSPLWFSSTSLIRDCSLQKNMCLVLGDIKSRVLTQLLKFDPIFASLFYSTSCVNLPLYKQVLYALTSLCKFSIMLSITSYGTYRRICPTIKSFMIISFILMTSMFDSEVILLGEVRCLSLLWVKGLDSYAKVSWQL